MLVPIPSSDKEKGVLKKMYLSNKKFFILLTWILFFLEIKDGKKKGRAHW